MSDKITDKKTRILHSAMKVFSQKGFHQAKIEEIAENADVGKGTVYEYFKSKEELFFEMFKAGSADYMDIVTAELALTNSAEEKIYKVIRTHFDFMKKNKELAKIMMQEHLEAGKQLREWFMEMRNNKLKMLEEIIIIGIANGELVAQNPAITATLITGMVGAAGGMLVFSPKAPDIEEIFQTIQKFLKNGIITSIN